MLQETLSALLRVAIGSGFRCDFERQRAGWHCQQHPTRALKMIANVGKPICRATALTLSALAAMTALAPSGARAHEQSDKLVKAYNQSGLELFGKLSAKPGNLVISPYSVGTAMAMALAGARGETQTEMAHALKQSLTGAALADANQRLGAVLAGDSAEQNAKVAIANALHLTGSAAMVADSYKQLLKEKFAAELFSGSDLAAINDWVSRKTNGKIKTILSRLDPHSVCVILNAIYFKGTWATAFDKDRTAPAAFHLSKSETVEVPTMRRLGKLRSLSTPDVDAVALPYTGGRLTMIILLPKRLAERGRAAIGMDGSAVAATMAKLRNEQPKPLGLTMPKFKMDFAADLIPPLRQLGMMLAFDGERADFSGITGTPKTRIHISQIRHKAFIDVNEAGTEAAAATAVESAARSFRSHDVLHIDHPFVYLIADEKSGAILFMGRMTDPRPRG
jgi:serine protease inhibitor